eukprot:scaffold5893_cov178-Ochromonas_danica.AAC.2
MGDGQEGTSYYYMDGLKVSSAYVISSLTPIVPIPDFDSRSSNGDNSGSDVIPSVKNIPPVTKKEQRISSWGEETQHLPELLTISPIRRKEVVVIDEKDNNADDNDDIIEIIESSPELHQRQSACSETTSLPTKPTTLWKITRSGPKRSDDEKPWREANVPRKAQKQLTLTSHFAPLDLSTKSSPSKP